MIGTTLGHFKITSLLGKGGMGAVYRAEDTRLGREVAIKVLPEEFTSNAERLARFEREAQVVASLNHPNICALYDVGHMDPSTPSTPSTSSGQAGSGRDRFARSGQAGSGPAAGQVHYLVMELVEGESLGERIKRGIEPDEAIGIATQIAEALEAAHARGIVHRDLKPANVMLNAEGAVKVLDFGLAKGWAAPTEASPSLEHSPTLTHQMTQAGMILGTAGYMSPEQARGDEADPRADIWAWGVILYEMLAGRQLFEEPTLSDTLAAVLRADLEWDKLPEETPRRVRTVLRRCLERNAKNRLHSIADARIELTSVEPDDRKDTEPAAPQRPSRAMMWIAAAVGALGLVIGAAGWWTRPVTTELPLRVLEVTGGKLLSNAAISPDGQRVVLNRGGRLFIRELDSTVETQIPGASDVMAVWTLFWSPDGRRIGYATSDEIYTVPMVGGIPQRVCEIPDGTYAEGIVLGATWWRPDTLVFGLDARGLWQVPAVGGEPEILLLPDREGKQESAFHHPALLPDGETLTARVRWRDKPNDTITFLRDGERTDVTFPGWVIEKAIVTSSGHLVFVREDQDAGIWAAPFSIEELRTTGDPVRLLAGRFQGLSVGASETLVTLAAQESRAQTVIVDREGNIDRAIEGLFYERDPAVSPDGNKLAVWGIRVHDGQRTVDVTRDRGSAPTWSPDGRELIYRTGRGGLFRVSADGSRDPVQLAEGWIDTPHWSPDGEHVAFTLYSTRQDVSERDALLGRDRTTDIEVLELKGSAEPRPFRDSPASELYPRFSPNGRFLAYASDASGRFEIYVASFPDGDRRWQVSVNGGRFPRWGATGNEIFFVAGGHLMATSFSAGTDVEIGAPVRLISTLEMPFRFSGFGQTAYDVTPDGRFAVMHFKLDEAAGAMLVQNWPALFERAR